MRYGAHKHGLLLFVISFLVIACPGDERHPFFDQPFEQRDSLLLQYPLEEQLDIYVEGVMRWHPPDIGLARPLARNGMPLVPLVLDELEGTTSEPLKVDLLRVLAEMSCHYMDLSGDEDVIERVVRVVASIENVSWRPAARRQLAKIRRETC